MHWKRKKKNSEGSIKQYSIVSKLRQEKRSNEEFEVMLGHLTMEEVIGIKLELATKSVDGKLYALPLWKASRDIFRDATVKYAFSACRSKADACSFLGLRYTDIWEIIKRYDVTSYFEKEQKNLTTQ